MRRYISLEYKARVVALADAHPEWGLKTLQKRGASRLIRKENLAQWKKDIETGGTIYDKFYKIETDTLERFEKARASGEQVKFINLRVLKIIMYTQMLHFVYPEQNIFLKISEHQSEET